MNYRRMKRQLGAVATVFLNALVVLAVVVLAVANVLADLIDPQEKPSEDA